MGEWGLPITAEIANQSLPGQIDPISSVFSERAGELSCAPQSPPFPSQSALVLSGFKRSEFSGLTKLVKGYNYGGGTDEIRARAGCNYATTGQERKGGGG